MRHLHANELVGVRVLGGAVDFSVQMVTMQSYVLCQAMSYRAQLFSPAVDFQRAVAGWTVARMAFEMIQRPSFSRCQRSRRAVF